MFAVREMLAVDEEYTKYADPAKITLGRVLRLELKLAKETLKQYDRVTALVPLADFETRMRMARRAAWFVLHPKLFIRELNNAIYTEFYKK